MDNLKRAENNSLKSKTLWLATALAISLVSWQIMLILGFVYEAPRTIWAIIDSYAISSLVLEASWALSASLIVARLLALAIYFVSSVLQSLFSTLARSQRRYRTLRRALGVFIKLFGKIKKIIRNQKYTIWSITATAFFCLIFLNSIRPFYFLTFIALLLFYLVFISDSRIFKIWEMERRAKEIVVQYSFRRSIRIFLLAGVFIGSATGFFVGQEKFKNRVIYVDAIQLDDDITARMKYVGGNPRHCAWSLILQTRSGYLLGCNTSAFDRDSVFLHFIPSAQVHAIHFTGPALNLSR